MEDLLPGANSGATSGPETENFQAEADRIEEELKFHLRPRFLKDEDNQRLLDRIGLQKDRGRVLLFLHEPTIRTNRQPWGAGSATGGDCAPAFPWFQE